MCALLPNVCCVPQGTAEAENRVSVWMSEGLTFPNECLALNPLFPKMLFLNGIFKCNSVRRLFQYLTLYAVKEFRRNLKQDI